jgi:tRNA A-37 threonylcarbamoyl transferase component Bud32
MIDRLGKYRIDGILGKGAMGIVYKGFDPGIERVVAIKTIRKDMFSEGEQADLIKRFKNEAQAAGRLVHPGIVTVYDYGEDADSAYIAMEFVDGTALDTLLVPNRPTDPARALAWMGDLLQGLAFAHARGVVHRDVKPANLLITHDDRVKITDFGIARIESSTLTQAGSMIGTPSYMSPEQFRGEPVDGRSDVFSAGIVLYQMLTGARPFVGAASSVMHQILNQHPAPPSQLGPGLGTRFDGVLARALAKAPAERFPSAQAFYEALLAAAGNAADPDATTLMADDDRTVLAGAAPMHAPAPGHASTPTGTGHGSGNGSDRSAIVTMTPWKREAFPEVEAALARQIGPMAKFLIKKTAMQAENLEALAELLLPHVPSELGRVEFRAALTQIGRKLDATGTGTGSGTASGSPGGAVSNTISNSLSNSASGTGTGFAAAAGQATGTMAPVAYDDAYADAVTQRLIALIGPIGRVVAKRAMKQTGDRAAFLQLLASHIDNPAERARFLAEAQQP